MGDIRFPCPECGGHLVIDERGAGMQLPCKHCGTRITVPTESPSAGPEAVEEPTPEPAAPARPSGLSLASKKEAPPPPAGGAMPPTAMPAGAATPGPGAPRPVVKTKAPGATAALVLGIVGFFICGLILGLVAISKANEAKKTIASAPDRYTGGGMATAGMVMGIIDVTIWGLGLIFRLIGFSAF